MSFQIFFGGYIMNRFNKAILFGLVSAIFGATGVKGLEIEKNFEVVSSNVERAKQSISIDGKRTELTALTGEKLADALTEVTDKTKVIYCYGFATVEKTDVRNLSEENKRRVATVYACWLTKAKYMTLSKAIEKANAKVGAESASKEIAREFYQNDLSRVDFTQFTTAASKAQPGWSVWKKIKALTLFGLLLTAGAGVAHRYAPSYGVTTGLNSTDLNVTGLNVTGLNVTDLNVTEPVEQIQPAAWGSQFMEGLYKGLGY